MVVESVYLVVLLAAVSIDAAVAGWLYRRATARPSRLLAILFAANGVTGAFVAAELLAPGPELARVAYAVHAGVAVVPPAALFLFAIAYAGDRQWLSDRRLSVAGAWVAVAVLFSVTDPLHGLAYTGFEPYGSTLPSLFGVQSLPYALLSLPLVFGFYAGLGLIGHRCLFGSGVDRRQSTALFVGFLPALAITGLLFTGWTVGPVNGWFVVGSAWSACFVVLAVSRYELFDLVPLAREAVVEHFEDGVIVVDEDRRLLDYNAAAERAFPSVSGRTGRRLDSVLPDLVASDGDEAFASSFTRYEDDGTREYAVSASALSRAGDVRGYGLIVRDVTERRKRIRDLEQKTAQLERFASTLSHDLRNPLTVARGQLELASEGRDDEHVQSAEAALERIEQIVDDVLLLSREGRTIDETDRERVDLADVATDAWETTDTRGAELVADPAADVAVYADRTRLRTVFENLVRNAVEHGGEDVTVTLGGLPNGFYLEDDGPGVPESDRDRIFEYEYSGEGGTGLGLAICDAIASAHGWDLRCEEGADGGARFVFAGADVTESRRADAAVPSP